jgi:uncharacterized iron-regulated membrane protein
MPHQIGLSKPGDYGGMPLKIIWALLDVVTLIALGSGLYLWAARLPVSPSLRPNPPTSTLAPQPSEHR